MRKLSYTVTSGILLLSLFVGFTVPAFAQQTGSNGSGLRVSPVRTDLVINPGDVKTISVSVQNVTSATVEYKSIINDFIAGDNELGQPALILDADKFAPSHSLKRFIGAVPNVVVPPGQTKEVKVTISIPKGAAGGGYFGAVRFIPASGEQGQNITLSASVGSLILVKVPGDIVENVKLISFDVRKNEKADGGSSFFVSNKNLYATARFQNNGNIHEQPFGKVLLKKGDKTLQTTEINNTDPKGNVLPDSVRRFTIKLDKVGVWGKYTVEGNFGYGTSGQLVSGQSSFYVIPLGLILGLLAVLVAVVFAIFGLPKAIKRYNQGVVRKANRRK